MVESTARVPLRALVTVGWDASVVFDHSRQVHEVPGGKGRVAVSEIILGTAGTFIEIRGTGSGFAQPPGICLGRYRVAEVLK